MATAGKGTNKDHIKGNGGHEPVMTDGRMDLTKSGKAFQLFDEMHKKDKNVQRKDCVAAAVEQADMTPASAATIYQNWRSERGLVHHDGD